MLKFDGTGPIGQIPSGLNPMIGWGRGPCKRGLGWRRGWNWQNLTKEDKLKNILMYKKNLTEELKAIEEEEKKLIGEE